MTHAPEIVSAKPRAGVFSKEFPVFVNELHPNSLAIDKLPCSWGNGIHPHHETSFAECDVAVRRLGSKELNDSLRKPGLKRFDQRAFANLIVSAESHSFDLKYPAIREFSACQRAASAGIKNRQSANNPSKDEKPQADVNNYASLRHWFSKTGRNPKLRGDSSILQRRLKVLPLKQLFRSWAI